VKFLVEKILMIRLKNLDKFFSSYIVSTSFALLENYNKKKNVTFVCFLSCKIIVETRMDWRVREAPACIEHHNHKFQQSAWNRNLFRELRRADLRGPRRDRQWIYGRWIMLFVRLGVERTSPMESERSGETNKIPKDILALKIDDAAAVNYVSLCSLMYDFLSTYLRFFRDNGA